MVTYGSDVSWMKSGIDLWQPEPSCRLVSMTKLIEDDTCNYRVPHSFGREDGSFPIPANIIFNVSLHVAVGNVAQRLPSGDDGLSLYSAWQVMLRRHFWGRDVDRNVELVFNLGKLYEVIENFNSLIRRVPADQPRIPSSSALNGYSPYLACPLSRSA